MARPRELLSLVLLIALATGVSIYVLREIGDHGDAAPEAAPATESTPASAPVPSPAPSPTTSALASAGPAVQPSAADHATRFRDATDYLAFARSLHAAARSGDVTAQYYLYRALEQCRPGGPSQQDERCRTFRESSVRDLGEAEQWLQMAATGGQPRAQVVYASKLLTNLQGLPPDEAIRTREDARRQVAAALVSKDPEVIFDAASVLILRSGGNHPALGDMEAWWLAACTRGLDCTPESERTRQVCRMDGNCQPFESLPDVIRRDSMDFESVTRRAAEISRAIEAGDISSLGFAP
jgi:hypothetical protein